MSFFDFSSWCTTKKQKYQSDGTDKEIFRARPGMHHGEHYIHVPSATLKQRRDRVSNQFDRYPSIDGDNKERKQKYEAQLEQIEEDGDIMRLPGVVNKSGAKRTDNRQIKGVFGKGRESKFLDGQHDNLSLGGSIGGATSSEDSGAHSAYSEITEGTTDTFGPGRRCSTETWDYNVTNARLREYYGLGNRSLHPEILRRLEEMQARLNQPKKVGKGTDKDKGVDGDHDEGEGEDKSAEPVESVEEIGADYYDIDQYDARQQYGTHPDDKAACYEVSIHHCGNKAAIFYERNFGVDQRPVAKPFHETVQAHAADQFRDGNRDDIDYYITEFYSHQQRDDKTRYDYMKDAMERPSPQPSCLRDENLPNVVDTVIPPEYYEYQVANQPLYHPRNVLVTERLLYGEEARNAELRAQREAQHQNHGY